MHEDNITGCRDQKTMELAQVQDQWSVSVSAVLTFLVMLSMFVVIYLLMCMDIKHVLTWKEKHRFRM
jgi:hypothetical protein